MIGTAGLVRALLAECVGLLNAQFLRRRAKIPRGFASVSGLLATEPADTLSATARELAGARKNVFLLG